MGIISLKNQKEFEFVNKNGIKLHGLYYILIVSQNSPNNSSHADFTKLGMKVSRKYSKKSVIRNKAKRRIRHLITLLYQDVAVNTAGKSLVIIPKLGFDKFNFASIHSNLKANFLKIALKLEKK